jgi:hypothetical protein
MVYRSWPVLVTIFSIASWYVYRLKLIVMAGPPFIVKLGCGCAGSPLRAGARRPHCQLETRPITIGAGEATAAVWILLSMVLVEKSG